MIAAKITGQLKTNQGYFPNPYLTCVVRVFDYKLVCDIFVCEVRDDAITSQDGKITPEHLERRNCIPYVVDARTLTSPSGNTNLVDLVHIQVFKKYINDNKDTFTGELIHI